MGRVAGLAESTQESAVRQRLPENLLCFGEHQRGLVLGRLERRRHAYAVFHQRPKQDADAPRKRHGQLDHRKIFRSPQRRESEFFFLDELSPQQLGRGSHRRDNIDIYA